MAIWQIEFQFVPAARLSGGQPLTDKQLAALLESGTLAYTGFTLPTDYQKQIGALLPLNEGWDSAMDLWGQDTLDDFTIWRDDGQIESIIARIDVRKFDETLLAGLLALATRWSCALVETRYHMVGPTTLPEFKSLIVGHSHTRAMRDPDAWFPLLSKEGKRDDEKP